MESIIQSCNILHGLQCEEAWRRYVLALYWTGLHRMPQATSQEQKQWRNYILKLYGKN